MRGEFLEQIRLWNRLEGLPKIDAEPLGDRAGLRFRVRFWNAEDGRTRALDLIGSYGGWVAPEPERRGTITPFSPAHSASR
jgi:hypothetical protein